MSTIGHSHIILTFIRLSPLDVYPLLSNSYLLRVNAFPEWTTIAGSPGW